MSILFSSLSALANLRENKVIANKKCFTVVHVLRLMHFSHYSSIIIYVTCKPIFNMCLCYFYPCHIQCNTCTNYSRYFLINIKKHRNINVKHWAKITLRARSSFFFKPKNIMQKINKANIHYNTPKYSNKDFPSDFTYLHFRSRLRLEWLRNTYGTWGSFDSKVRLEYMYH